MFSNAKNTNSFVSIPKQSNNNNNNIEVNKNKKKKIMKLLEILF